MHDYMTLKRAAESIGCSDRYLGYLVQAGTLDPIRINRIFFLTPEEVEKARAIFKLSPLKRPPLNKPTEDGDRPLSIKEQRHLAALEEHDRPSRESAELYTLRRRYKLPDATLDELKALDSVRRDRVRYKTLRNRYPHVNGGGK